MKPEVRRALAKEWLILMAVATVATLCRAGWLYYKNKELKSNESAAEWVSENAAENESMCRGLYRKHTATSIELLRETPTEDQDTSVIIWRELKEEYQKKLQVAQQELFIYQDPTTLKGGISAATWAVEWSWLAYLGLWVPRLTVGSIRLLRNSETKTAQPQSSAHIKHEGIGENRQDASYIKVRE